MIPRPQLVGGFSSATGRSAASHDSQITNILMVVSP